MTRTGVTVTAAESADRQRSDAQHNRERILTVAREALGASVDPSLNSIAKKAGVGPGTLYRHFPSREALVLAVYQEDVRNLTDSAADLLAQHQPLLALRLWLDRLASCGMTNHSLAGALHSATSEGLAGQTYEPVSGAAALLLSACRQGGSIRQDIEPDDVLLLLGFLWRIEPGPDAASRVTRLLDLVVTGLQAGAPRAPGSRAGRRPLRRSLRLRRRLSLVPLSTPRSI